MSGTMSGTIDVEAILRAIEINDLTFIDFLPVLAPEISLDLSNEEGLTPLYLAAQLGNLPAGRTLLNHGANPDFVYAVRDRHGWAPLLTAMAEGHEDIVTVLLDAGANPSLTSTDGEQDSPLLFAIEDGREEMVELLLERGARITPRITDTAADGPSRAIERLIESDRPRWSPLRNAWYIAVERAVIGRKINQQAAVF